MRQRSENRGAAGYFGLDGKVESGEPAWLE
jgi:hypothetical protein